MGRPLLRALFTPRLAPFLHYITLTHTFTGFIFVSKPTLFSHMNNEIFSSGWLENVVWPRKEKSCSATEGHSWQDFPIYQLSSKQIGPSTPREPQFTLASSDQRSFTDWNPAPLRCFPLQLLHFAYSATSLLSSIVSALIQVCKLCIPPTAFLCMLVCKRRKNEILICFWDWRAT